jgi:hypothetical protein
MQAGGDPVNGSAQRVVEFGTLLAFLFTPQKFDLDQTHGIDIGITQADGAGQDAVSRQKLALSSDAKNHTAGAVKFFFEQGEDFLSQDRVLDEP